jgi:predicted nucleotidyltransferase
MSGAKKVRFLKGDEIEEAVREVASMVKGTDDRPVLVGGAAMQLYGSDRLTKDVDFMARKIPPGMRVERKLSFGGAGGRTPGGIPICIIIRDDDYRKLYEESRRKAADVGLPLKVVAPEYLAAIKLAAGRAKDEEDLKKLLGGKAIKMRVAREIVKRILGAYAADDFDSYVREVEWLRERDRRR